MKERRRIDQLEQKKTFSFGLRHGRIVFLFFGNVEKFRRNFGVLGSLTPSVLHTFTVTVRHPFTIAIMATVATPKTIFS